MAARIAMIAITTRSSIRVKARFLIESNLQSADNQPITSGIWQKL
jgi:hypothetical protein